LTIKIGSRNNLYPHKHFTKQLVTTFRKSPQESDLNHEFSSLLIQRLKRFTENSLRCSTQKFIRKQAGQEKRVLSRSYQTNQPGQEQASAHDHTQPGQNQIWPGSELAMGKSKHTQQEAALGENLS
jgi:hypothetical protein